MADDGKRWYSDGRFISKGEMILKKWRGGLGEGEGVRDRAGWEVGGYIFRCFLEFFFCLFFRCSF